MHIRHRKTVSKHLHKHFRRKEKQIIKCISDLKTKVLQIILFSLSLNTLNVKDKQTNKQNQIKS